VTTFDDLPRVTLAHVPTPLEALGSLREQFGGPRVWIKRDDCTGLAGGGNKTRKLEYLIAEAEAEGAQAVVTFGALQSNHARQTAAACARRGLACDLILAPAVARTADDYERSGNLLLDDLLGARLHRLSPGQKAQAMLEDVLAQHAAAGRRAYVIPTGGSNATGALGYVRAAREIAAQCRDRGIYPAAVIHATSTGGTQSGLLAGFRLEGLSTRVIGINVYTPNSADLATRIEALTAEVLARLAPGMAPAPLGVEVVDGFLGDGYGVPTEAMAAAVRVLASGEAVLLDPVYSGKAMAGLLAMLERQAFVEDDDLIFLHTGGAQALSVYTSAFAGG